MKIPVIFIVGFLFNFVQCYDSESLEYNGIEVSPLYETIIYSDIADIINEFENNNLHSDKPTDSESDEDVEDLLSEYHHYLEKAHKQKVNYLEKNKLKNKVPIIRHEKFTKMKTSSAGKHQDYFKSGFFNSEHKFPPVLNPFNMFIPFNANKYLTTSEQPVFNNDLNALKKIVMTDERPMSPFSSIPVRSSCSCKDGRASCKQCLMSPDMQQRANANPMLHSDEEKAFLNNNPLFPEQSDDTINVRIKVDVQLPKSQQERLQSYNMQNRDKVTDYDAGLSKEYLSSIKLPSPYYSFPIPMNVFGHKKVLKNNKHDTSPLHKISIHKKKKPKVTNGNKKHRKKVITFHNIKIEPQLYQTQYGMFNVTDSIRIYEPQLYQTQYGMFNVTDSIRIYEPQLYQTQYGMFNVTDSIRNETESNNTVVLNLQANKTQTDEENVTTASSVDNVNVTEAQTEENILLLVNITNNIDNATTEKNKTENSIETEYTNSISNATTDTPLHLIRKREVASDNKPAKPPGKPTVPSKKSIVPKKKFTSTLNNSSTSHNKSNTTQSKSNTLQKKTTIPVKKSTNPKKKIINKNKTSSLKTGNNSSTVAKLTDKEKSNITKIDKNLPTDIELLYWPNNEGNKSADITKNITAIILESENKKAKLNMSKESMRRNHTRALEQAIFGNVDWNDVDAVAPAFISFVGKYIEGILTFCNERICHSMKCTKKSCLHRVCAPKDRFNNKGHCTGSNDTDSAASMESIMDLPSNVAFEIVDILQDRMIGKLFGKITLCINFKCITFASSKKVFHKHKCMVKELSPKGHCISSKEVKVA